MIAQELAGHHLPRLFGRLPPLQLHSCSMDLNGHLSLYTIYTYTVIYIYIICGYTLYSWYPCRPCKHNLNVRCLLSTCRFKCRLLQQNSLGDLGTRFTNCFACLRWYAHVRCAQKASPSRQTAEASHDASFYCENLKGR